MSNPELSMPLAVPPPGVDRIAFYATFSGKLVSEWTPATGLLISVDPLPDIARLHAPIKAAMKFVKAGIASGNAVVPRDSLFLDIWPMAYTAIKEILGTTTPAQIRIVNVDAAAVRAAVTPLFAAIGRPASVVDAFMAGDGLLKVAAGTAIGAAAPDPAAPATTPNRVKIEFIDATRSELNPVQFLSEAATHLQIDKTLHPILKQLDLDGWVEMIVHDETGAALAAEPYTLYLSDGSTRSGTTDAGGRLFESRIPKGGWGIDFPNHPSISVGE